MRVATLTIEGELSGSLALQFTHDHSSRPMLAATSPVGELSARIGDGRASGRDVAGLLPQEVLRALRQWYHDGGASGTLAVVSQSAELDLIPWERVPALIGLPDLCVVRLLPERTFDARDGDYGGDLLVVGWIGAPTLNLVGIQKELSEFAQLNFPKHFRLRVMAEPTAADLYAAWAADRPRCVHIAAPAIVYGASGPRLAISGTDTIEYVPLDRLLAQSSEGVRLVLLNTCDGAFAASHYDPWVDENPAETITERGRQLSVARIIAERLGAITISWYGTVGDMEASDFARFFYSRLLEGDTAVEGIRKFNRIRSLSGAPDRASRDLAAVLTDEAGAVPVLWGPSIDAFVVPPFEFLAKLGPTVDEPRRRARAKEAFATPPVADEGPSVSVDFEPQRWLNPALLKNQRPAIVRVVLNARHPLQGVGVSITCDTGIGQSTIAMTRDLERGPQPVPVDQLHFPVLYQLIDQAAGRRWVNFTLRCTHHGTVLTETTRSVLWMGLAEWMDRKDMWHFIPAFVDPNSDGVLRVLDEANTLLRKLDPTSAFDGYQGGDMNFVRRQVEAIFGCLRDAPFELSYINVPPLEVYVPDESMPSGQRVRTPNQVIEHRRGTCHDLAILLASCLEHIGVHPLVILKPGHTYTGYWTTLGDWQEFWKRARANVVRLPNVAGRNWIINSVDELTPLVNGGQIVLLEATRVTDRNARFDDALSKGRAHLRGPDSFDVAVDVRASRQLIQPL